MLHELVQQLEKIYPEKYIDISHSFVKFSNSPKVEERYYLYIQGIETEEFVTLEALEIHIDNLMAIV